MEFIPLKKNKKTDNVKENTVKNVKNNLKNKTNTNKTNHKYKINIGENVSGDEDDNNKIFNEPEENKEKERQSENEVEDEEERAKQKKYEERDRKKINRLFIKTKKKITSECEIKELHPDIKKVIFPRKKNPKWCWAVFVSQERAQEAFPALAKNKSIFVSKPNPQSFVELKRSKKMATLKRKELAKKKHLNAWI